MKLMITGGHPAPAIACLDEIRKSPDIHAVYVGRQYVSGSHEETFEYQEVGKRHTPFVAVSPGRFTRTLTVGTVREFLKIPGGMLEGFRVVSREKPDAVLSFGSYIALPIAIAARLQGIPVYTHEQTMHPGLGNRIISWFARKVFVSFPQSARYFRRQVTVTGNPIRAEVLKPTRPERTIEKSRPLIYITGGSLGSHSINELIKAILPQLLEDYIVVHQTGNVAEYGDFQTLETIRTNLPGELSRRYHPYTHIPGGQVGYLYSIADLVIARSGANTFFELVALRKPAILIPLPWSSHNEQHEQAQAYQEEGLGEVFLQDGRPEDLLALIRKMMADLSPYQRAFTNSKLASPANAASRIIGEIIG